MMGAVWHDAGKGGMASTDFYSSPNPKKDSPPLSANMAHAFDVRTTYRPALFHTLNMDCNKKKKQISPTGCKKTELPYGHKCNYSCYREAETLTVLLLNLKPHPQP